MSVTVTRSTLAGGLTPVCRCCAIALCWDISEEEYEQDKGFWDALCCQECNGGVPMSLKAYRAAPKKGQQ